LFQPCNIRQEYRAINCDLQVNYLAKAQRRKVLATFLAALRLCEKTTKINLPAGRQDLIAIST